MQWPRLPFRPVNNGPGSTFKWVYVMSAPHYMGLHSNVVTIRIADMGVMCAEIVTFCGFSAGRELVGCALLESILVSERRIRMSCWLQ